LYLAGLEKVALVGDEEDGDLGTGVLVDLLDPVLDVVKGGCLVDRIGEDDYQGPLVEGGRKVLEFLLPRSVPNLQLYFQLFDLQRFYLKVDADRRGIRGFETIVAVAE